MRNHNTGLNNVHETAQVGSAVEMGEGNTIGPYAVLEGNLTLGDNNWIGPHVVIGTPPEHRTARESRGHSGFGPIWIGSKNIIHEFATIQAPTGIETRIGSNCFIMNKSHIAHDCQVADSVTLAPTAILGGHCIVEFGANIGLGALVHQWRTIPELAMVGMQAVVTRDLPPYTIIVGIPARAVRLNRLGLERAGFDGGFIDDLELDLIKSEASQYGYPDQIDAAIDRWMKRTQGE